jgi:hypothetical protein
MLDPRLLCGLLFQPREEQMVNRPRKEKLILQAPSPLVEAVDKAATQRFTSRAEYIRRAVLEALQRDGVPPVAA